MLFFHQSRKNKLLHDLTDRLQAMDTDQKLKVMLTPILEAGHTGLHKAFNPDLILKHLQSLRQDDPLYQKLVQQSRAILKELNLNDRLQNGLGFVFDQQDIYYYALKKPDSIKYVLQTLIPLTIDDLRDALSKQQIKLLVNRWQNFQSKPLNWFMQYTLFELLDRIQKDIFGQADDQSMLSFNQLLLNNAKTIQDPTYILFQIAVTQLLIQILRSAIHKYEDDLFDPKYMFNTHIDDISKLMPLLSINSVYENWFLSTKYLITFEQTDFAQLLKSLNLLSEIKIKHNLVGTNIIHPHNGFSPYPIFDPNQPIPIDQKTLDPNPNSQFNLLNQLIEQYVNDERN